MKLSTVILFLTFFMALSNCGHVHAAENPSLNSTVSNETFVARCVVAAANSGAQDIAFEIKDMLLTIVDEDIAQDLLVAAIQHFYLQFEEGHLTETDYKDIGDACAHSWLLEYYKLHRKEHKS